MDTSTAASTSASSRISTSTSPSASVLRTVHEQFVTSLGTPSPSGVRRLVADSWSRCTACGVRPDGSRLPALFRTWEELATYRRGHPLAAVLPLLRELLGAGVADDGHLFAVGDADGTLLWVEGDSAALRRAERMHFVAGAVWSEAQAGTNALGTALEVRQPVQIVAGEHYNSAVHDWSCAAAPVRDPGTGRLLGVVDLSGGATIATPPALAAVRAAALPAEAELARALPVPPTPLGPDGWVPHASSAGCGAGAGPAALGRDCALLESAGRVHRLSPRHGEIVVALALEGRGVHGDRLAVDLSEREVPPSTLRAEMTRLLAVLGPALLGSRPYALLCPVRTDFGEVSALLAEGRVDEALALPPVSASLDRGHPHPRPAAAAFRGTGRRGAPAGPEAAVARCRPRQWRCRAAAPLGERGLGRRGLARVAHARPQTAGRLGAACCRGSTPSRTGSRTCSPSPSC
jgi:hypothetical protein